MATEKDTPETILDCRCGAKPVVGFGGRRIGCYRSSEHPASLYPDVYAPAAAAAARAWNSMQSTGETVKVERELWSLFRRLVEAVDEESRQLDVHTGAATTEKLNALEAAKTYLKSTSPGEEKDNCAFCLGAKGGVRGNENVVGGVIVCDYCSALLHNMQKSPGEEKPSGEFLKCVDALASYVNSPLWLRTEDEIRAWLDGLQMKAAEVFAADPRRKDENPRRPDRPEEKCGRAGYHYGGRAATCRGPKGHDGFHSCEDGCCGWSSGELVRVGNSYFPKSMLERLSTPPGAGKEE